jgi:hypothetical protein
MLTAGRWAPCVLLDEAGCGESARCLACSNCGVRRHGRTALRDLGNPRLLYPPLGAVALQGVTSVHARIQLQQAQSQLATSARSAVLQALAGLVLVAGAAATW